MSAMVHRMLKAPVFTHMSHMRSSNKEFYVRWGIVGFFSLVITWVYLMPRNDYSAIGDKDTYIVDEKGPRKL
ncbi:hypothetical protein B484DRAFT_402355 [Ochromonadaceae sp. CCMP2298]|nr:hypothetical protein B484DRAFT_402355 [Ochromonadaceae sp. CCMP2298]